MDYNPATIRRWQEMWNELPHLRVMWMREQVLPRDVSLQWKNARKCVRNYSIGDSMAGSDACLDSTFCILWGMTHLECFTKTQRRKSVGTMM